MKKKVGVIFGGKSTEHDVSIVSGTSVIKNLNKDKYDIIPIYINKNGDWFLYKKEINKIDILTLGTRLVEVEPLENVFECLKSLDVIFPVLHGLYGEDGTIQGLFEMLGIPYVGCRVLSSSLCMDKAYTKIILEKANIPQVKHVYIYKRKNDFIIIDERFNEIKVNTDEIVDVIKEKLGLPVFIKPSNSGSSVGVNKSSSVNEIIDCINYASRFDNKIIVEEAIEAREIECAVIGNEDVKVSILGEILSADDFYSYDAKYLNSESLVQIPAKLSEEVTNLIQKYAVKAFKAVDGKGLSRVDFFVDKNNGNVYLNEINTLPGFTNISMYPQLFENCGISYEKLLDMLIECAF